jgi:uncharacterized protein (DUF1810 family)
VVSFIGAIVGLRLRGPHDSGVATRRPRAMPMTDPFDLQRFVDAQAPAFEAACDELRAGRKRGHWMWFVFPQLRGLGHSAMAERYGIGSLAEARAYLAHPLLGSRLARCTRLVLQGQARGVHAIFGSPDDLKFHSCMTLFAKASGDGVVFDDTLRAMFDGRPDAATLGLLATLQA